MKNINEIKSRLFTDDVLSLKTSNKSENCSSYFNALAGDSIERKDIATIYFTHLERDEMDILGIGINSDSLPSGATPPKGMLYFCGDLNKENATYYSSDIRQLIALYPRTHKVGNGVIKFDLLDILEVNNVKGNVSLSYKVIVTGAAKMLSQRMKDLITEDFIEYEYDYGEDCDFDKISERSCSISFRVSVVEPKGKRVSFYDKAVRANLLILGFIQEFLLHHKEDANADAIEGFEEHSYMTKFLHYALSKFDDQVNLCDFKGSDGLSIELLTQKYRQNKKATLIGGFFLGLI